MTNLVRKFEKGFRTVDPLAPGDIYDDGSGDTYVVLKDGSSAKLGAAGGSQPGAAIWHKLGPFAYNHAALNAGISIYVPTVGDLLIDAWVCITMAWDGTTPKGDIGWAANHGVYALLADGTLDMTKAATLRANVELLSGSPSDPSPTDAEAGVIGTNLPTAPSGGFPMVFQTTDPLLLWVSQDGNQGGAAPGSSQGSAIVYLQTATPA